jgi:hypothetical protein
MSVNDSFRKDVRKWVKLDDKVAKAKQVIKKVDEKKNDISDNIVKFLADNNLEKKEIKIANSKLKCSTRTVTTPLTKAFITGCLTEFIGNFDEAKEAVKLMYTPKEKIKICLEYFFDDEERAEEATEFIFSKRTKTVKKKIRREIEREEYVIEDLAEESNTESNYEL